MNTHEHPGCPGHEDGGGVPEQDRQGKHRSPGSPTRHSFQIAEELEPQARRSPSVHALASADSALYPARTVQAGGVELFFLASDRASYIIGGYLAVDGRSSIPRRVGRATEVGR